MDGETAEGLCPRCLMAANFDSRTMPQGEERSQVPSFSLEEIQERFPQFEIQECLGRGGMGVVYKARQKVLDRDVAIKLLAGEWQGDEGFAEKFEKEAKTLAQMSHPNIVTVHDFGETEGLYYIVMEFVDGVNLRDLICESKIDPEQALKIVPPICEALQYAHDKGVVHRDIKPENLLLDREGRVKIADFGIASLIGTSGENSGTPPYMAPEQGAHSEVDHRADIYALGVVLYEMLTGERPTSPLDLPSQKVELDIRLDDIVMRAMSEKPERRYRTAKDFQTVVQTITPEQTSSAGTEPDEPKASSPSPVKRPGVEHRIIKALGITIVIAGALNGLTTLGSLVVIPFLSLLMGFRVGPAEISNGFGVPIDPGFMLTGGVFAVVVVLSIVYTLVVSTLSIIGGRHMYQGTSRAWAFTGAIACCLTPLWWPLGLVIGLAAVIMLIVYADTLQNDFVGNSVESDAPRISIMAVISALLVVMAVLSCGVLLVFTG